MRHFTFFLLTFLVGAASVLPARAQSAGAGSKVQVSWQGTTQVATRTGQLRVVPTFAGAFHRPGELVGTLTIRLEAVAGSVQLRNAVYAPFSPAEARLLEASTLPQEPTYRLVNGTEMRRPVSQLIIQPVRRNSRSGQAEKLVSFEYTYSAPATAARGTQARTYASSSVLSSGQWFKIGVPTSGVYKLTKPALAALGLDLNTLDPRRLQIYGNATGMLPQANAVARPDDLVENAIYVSGNNDGVFDDTEFVLFYSPGPHRWEKDPDQTAAQPRFRHQLNLYSDTAYYFIRASNGNSQLGRRVSPAPAATGTPSATPITRFTYRDYHEVELVNLLKSGREWLGEGFSTGTRKEFTFTVPDLAPNSTVQITSAVAATSLQNSPTTFQASLNGTSLGSSQVVPGLSGPSSSYPEAANTRVNTFYSQLGSSVPSELRVALAYSGGADPSASGYLDYLEVNALRQLRLTGSSPLEFRSFENVRAGAVSEFRLGNAAGAMVWDVTNPRRPVSRPLDANGAFLAPTDSIREYVAFTLGSSFPTPRNFGKVANQNLHSRLNLNGQLDLVVVTYPAFLPEAQRLARHRARHDGLRVEVVTTKEVYNEFSSGSQDVTAIRDMMKMVYDRAAPGKRNYLLLFGDASYDYKSSPWNDVREQPTWWTSRLPLNNNEINQNYVPVYESRESFSQIFPRVNGLETASYSSDDYFGILDDNEGEWSETSNDFMDVAVGRLPIRTPRNQPRSTLQASAVVDKLIAYDSISSFGKWRNRMTYVADDGDGASHVISSAEPRADSLVRFHQDYNAHKLYLDMFPQITAAAGQRSPEMNRAVEDAFEQGSLVIDYSGHGGPRGWADEQILTSASILRLQNRNRLTFIFAATCDFSTYDNPEFTSAGEQSLTDTNGGAIGLFTSTRLVYQSNNDALGAQFNRHVFRPINGRMPRIGDVLLPTKNLGSGGAGVLNRNYALLGDPSMRLAYPEQDVAIRTVNSIPVTGTARDSVIMLRALSRVTMTGDVSNRGAVNTTFNGIAQVTIFEKPTLVRTLGNEPGDGQRSIKVQENVIYDGQATVRNGQFTLTFVVPKDINYSVGIGKISLYAYDRTNRVDANGNTPIPIGGASTIAQVDTIPPVIKLFMDNRSFVFGGLTGLSPTLIADLSDDNGINTAGSGIGHDITATLDNDPAKLTILNDFYTAETDNFRAGTVTYAFKDLSQGPHVLRLKCWDTFNNSAQKDIEFIAASSESLALKHVLNYPNPFSTSTTFHFDHNQSGQELEVQVQIFTVSGKLVRTLEANFPGSGSHVPASVHDDKLTWNGRDEYDGQLARGVYVYRVNVRTPDGSTASKFEKLVILN
ncbi:type IX secretion system sortase PorU [Hymenobacter sp. BT175]|uniref:type IX secretion system sortase PorU n=1 Tax=Hymenobacter translucens TaxID=2886507 RepID=UPI001D0DCE13|nr:type IX secretion system sortase PorU [Hymenobacter translucens]MCC2547494.1 type IX secretion system sortase PorU [Hymenobacter translucens]